MAGVSCININVLMGTVGDPQAVGRGTNTSNYGPRSKPRGTAVKDLSPGEQLTRSARHQDDKRAALFIIPDA